MDADAGLGEFVEETTLEVDGKLYVLDDVLGQQPAIGLVRARFVREERDVRIGTEEID